jgi:hypothetical protein
MIGLGWVSELEGKPDDADRWLAQAMETNPEDPIAPYIAGKLLFNRYVGAAPGSDKIPDADPSNLVRAQEMLSRSLLLDRTHAETLALYGMTFLFSPTDSVYQGLSALTEAIERTPGRLDVLVALMGLSARVGNRSGVQWLLKQSENTLAGRESAAESLITVMFADERDPEARAGLAEAVLGVQRLKSNRLYDDGLIALARGDCEWALIRFKELLLTEDEALRQRAKAMIAEAMKCVAEEEEK